MYGMHVTPAFLSLSRDEVSTWLDNSVTKSFVEWLQWEIDRGKDATVDLVAKGAIKKARMRTGTLFALYNILGSFERPQVLPEPEEEPFIDPAAFVEPKRGAHDSEG